MNLDVDEDDVSLREPSNQQINFEAMRAKLAQLKKENNELRRGQLQDPLEGYADHEVPTVADLRRLQQYESQRINANTEYLKETVIKTRYSDYDEILNKYTKKAFEESPVLLEGLHSTSDKPLYAYQIGKMKQLSEEGNKNPQDPHSQNVPSNNIDRMINNSKLPGNLSECANYATSGAMESDSVWDMSEQDFEKFYEKQTGCTLDPYKKNM